MGNKLENRDTSDIEPGPLDESVLCFQIPPSQIEEGLTDQAIEAGATHILPQGKIFYDSPEDDDSPGFTVPFTLFLKSLKKEGNKHKNRNRKPKSSIVPMTLVIPGKEDYVIADRLGEGSKKKFSNGMNIYIHKGNLVLLEKRRHPKKKEEERGGEEYTQRTLPLKY